MRRPATTIWLTATLLWCVYGLIYAEQLVDAGIAAGEPIGWRAAAWTSLAGLVLCWVPLSAALAFVVRRYPVERGHLHTHGAILLLAVTVAALLRGVFVWVLNPVFGFWYDVQPPLLEVLWHSLRYNFVLGLMIVGFAHAWVYAQRAQADRQRIVELESGLLRARLDALLAQLNPHFLFNALNAVAELIHSNPQTAERMLVALSALLRRSLASSTEQQVPLEAELELVAHYLDIEQIRFGDRLQVRWSIDPRCAAARVPVLMLQPLAENAIVHGIAAQRASGSIDIAVQRVESRLVIEVIDDGKANAATPQAHGSGIGLGNARARLRCLYGEDWSLDLHRDAAGRSVVRVEFPFQTDAALPPQKAAA